MSEEIVAHFKIIGKLGQGGMGVVLLAEDLKLDRKVALKFLPTKLAADPESRQRFITEARAASALNHPNVCTIYEVRETGDEQPYIVMEYVEGQTLDKIDKLDPEANMDIGLQVASALDAAHSKGIVHRDIKPSNISITDGGQVKVLDFGLAKRLTLESSTDGDATTQYRTQRAQLLGTPNYMSPEQSLGLPVDHRSDVFSLGIVLYQLSCDCLPFLGTTPLETLHQIVNTTPQPIKELNPRIPPKLARVILKCLEKEPDARYQSAGQLAKDLETVKRSSENSRSRRALLTLTLPIIAVGLILSVAGVSYLLRKTDHEAARSETLSLLRQCLDRADWDAAYRLFSKHSNRFESDPEFQKFLPEFTRPLSIEVSVSGANVDFKPYPGMEEPWRTLGTTPLEKAPFPKGIYRLRLQKVGYQPRETVIWGNHATESKFQLAPGGSHHNMIPIRSGRLEIQLMNIDPLPVVDAPAYFIDKHEVTNDEYKKFVDAGGYENPEIWQQPFVLADGSLTWKQAMDRFRDRTGRHGPYTWEGGTYQPGTGRHPVAGVSWHEAAAYARFAGKSLPTVHHWARAASLNIGEQITSWSNYHNTGPDPVGENQGIGEDGLYDMAGNVREWCWNAVEQSGEERYILGGSYADEAYLFGTAFSLSSWDRSPFNGFRCIVDSSQESPLQSLYEMISPPTGVDWRTIEPLPRDSVVKYLHDFYDYDVRDLNSSVEATEESAHWLREKIVFDAAYDEEKVIAYLYLPKNVQPPFQIVINFPGAGGGGGGPIEGSYFHSYHKSILLSGRAFLYPIYKGAHERKFVGEVPSNQKFPLGFRDWIIKQCQDVRRTIDYLQTRKDIDADRIAYLGLSWGSAHGPINVAAEPRIKLAIFLMGGFWDKRAHPAVEGCNFAPLIKVPVLMINGREDQLFPYDLSQSPMFNLLGTPPEDKVHKLYTGGHAIQSLNKDEINMDVLRWLDRYFGRADGSPL